MSSMKTPIDSSAALLSRVHSAASDFLEKSLSQKGLPNFASSHGFILFSLSRKKTMTMTELSQKINRDKSTMTALARKLEKKGLVKISASENDARAKVVSLTAKGKKYNEATSLVSRELSKKFYAGFSPKEKRQFVDFLSRIEGNFRAKSDSKSH